MSELRSKRRAGKVNKFIVNFWSRAISLRAGTGSTSFCKRAQALSRHSTITLTLDRCVHLGMVDLSGALDRLSELPGNEAPEAQRNHLVATARRIAKSGVWYIFRPRRYTILDYSMTEIMYLTPSP